MESYRTGAFLRIQVVTNTVHTVRDFLQKNTCTVLTVHTCQYHMQHCTSTVTVFTDTPGYTMIDPRGWETQRV